MRTITQTDNANESNDYPGKSFKYFEENLKNEDTDESAEDVIFQASQGWFKKFNIKNRFNLHNLKKKLCIVKHTHILCNMKMFHFC